MLFTLPNFQIPQDLVYHLGSKDINISIKNEKAKIFYEQYGLEGVRALWMMMGTNYLSSSIHNQLISDWWLHPENCFKDMMIEHFSTYNIDDSINMI